MAETTITTKQAARILAIVQRVDAASPKVKTAFLSVMGEDLRSSGLTVDDVRAAMQAASDMGVEADPEEATETKSKRRPSRKGQSSLKQLADNEADQAEREIAQEEKKGSKGKAKAAAAKPKAQAKPKSAPKSKEPVEVTPAQAKKILAERQAEDEKWEKVIAITEFTSNGKPARVDIRCVDPDTDEPIKGSAGVRNIKVQDLFQVRYTVEGSKRARALQRQAKRAAAAAPAPKPTAKATRTRAARSKGKK